MNFLVSVDLPLWYPQGVWFEADAGWPVGEIVLIYIYSQGNVLVLEVSLELLSGFLQKTQLFKGISNFLLKSFFDSLNDLYFLLTKCFQLFISFGFNIKVLEEMFYNASWILV